MCSFYNPLVMGKKIYYVGEQVGILRVVLHVSWVVGEICLNSLYLLKSYIHGLHFLKSIPSLSNNPHQHNISYIPLLFNSFLLFIFVVPSSPPSKKRVGKICMLGAFLCFYYFYVWLQYSRVLCI